MSGAPMAERAEVYCRRRGLILGNSLGYGVHGKVFEAKSQSRDGKTAIKIHEQEKPYRREHNIYLRLCEFSVNRVRSATVPELILFDDELWIFEMTMVVRPFVLDFAGAYLDLPPDYSEQVWVEWRAEKMEQFGER